MTKTQELIDQANSTHAQYPQYKGHWDTWLVAEAKRNIRIRGRQVAAKGDQVLFNPASFTTAAHPDVLAGVRAAGFVTVFLPNYCEGGMDASVSVKNVMLAG